MTQTPESLCQALIDAARKAGADAADAMAAEGSSLSIEVRQGALEHAERSEGIDLGLRVFIGQTPTFICRHPTRLSCAACLTLSFAT